MKCISFVGPFLLSLLFSTSTMVYAQRGERTFYRGVKLADEGKYYKAGMKFIRAYGKGYYPAFESLAYAGLVFNTIDYNSPAIQCFHVAELNAPLL